MAQSGGARRHPRIRRASPARIPARRLRMDKRNAAARFPSSHGRVGRTRRARRLHQTADREDRSLRQPAGGSRTRQSSPLRDCDKFLRVRPGDRRHEPRRPPDQDRGQSGPSREPRRDHHLGAGRRARSLRLGAGQSPNERGLNRHFWSVSRSSQSRPLDRAGPRRGRFAHSHPDGDLADDGGADAGDQAKIPGGRMAPMGTPDQ